MRRLVALPFLIVMTLTMNMDCIATRIGYIRNASYVSTNATNVITYQNTCDECICYGLLSDTTLAYVGFNCYQSNKTCAFFANYSFATIIQMNLDSTFIFHQQPPPQSSVAGTLRVGVTVAGYGNGTSGNALNALNTPWGLAFGADQTLFVSDLGNSRVLRIREGNLTGSLVAGSGVAGSTTAQFGLPVEIAVDADSNVYVNDDFNYRVMLWRRNATSGIIKAGTGVVGSTLDKLNTSAGLALDSRGNIYVGDHGNHRVMKWSVNATIGTIVAGVTGVSGSGSALLNEPYGLYLDENNSYIYIADYKNHRIQRQTIGGGIVGVTVAGGNGQGSNDDQLNLPYAVCVSKTTGDIYVADAGNHRVQRWSPGATAGVTIAGVTGVNGTNATLLNKPTAVMLSKNESFLYVSDGYNHRVQRFELT